MSKALLIKPRIGDLATGVPVGIDVRYLAGKPLEEICNLALPCDADGHISPDAVLMLIAYLKRIIEPYGTDDSE